MDKLSALLDQALRRRRGLIERLIAEGTDCYRLFHGVAEGLPGLTIDRYGPLVLVQTFREPLPREEQQFLGLLLGARLNEPFELVFHHRGKTTIEREQSPKAEAFAEIQCQEQGVKFCIRAQHQGIDPWLFLDLRAGRRPLRASVEGLSVLNLFSYTCTAGVVAAVAGASEVWNVDFAASSLEVGRRNAALNGIDGSKFQIIQEDCLPVMRQLAGLPAGGRRNKVREFVKFEPRHFDVVFLDPPAWSKGGFGAVDIENDYQSLFKSAALIARPRGGRVIATNHLAAVALADWIEILKRCAAKAGRPLHSCEVIVPEEDFPSFDGRHPLKIVICEL